MASENFPPLPASPLAKSSSFSRRFLFRLAAAAVVGSFVAAQAADKPTPLQENVSFGTHPHQLLDVYVPPGGGEAKPVLIWFGGLWEASKHVPDLNRFFPAGIAVVGVQSRTLKDAVQDKVDPPISYPMSDAIRAVQFVRTNAARWNLDPRRIAVGGGSQGSLPALFVGCAGERANPVSTDPVERASSKVVAVAAYRSQPSIDPKQMQEWVPGVKWGAPALGGSFEDSLRRREDLLPVIRKWSPDALLHAGAAPIYFENEWGLTKPADIEENNYKVHAPAWALGFQKVGEKAGAVVYVKFPDHPTEGYRDIWDFLVKKLASAP